MKNIFNWIALIEKYNCHFVQSVDSQIFIEGEELDLKRLNLKLATIGKGYIQTAFVYDAKSFDQRRFCHVIDGTLEIAQEELDIFFNRASVAVISKDNLNEKSLTNREVMQQLESLAGKLDDSGSSRVLDVIEHLTGSRDFELDS